MGMRDDRVIGVEMMPVRYRKHHLYDGSKYAGQPHGPALRGVRLTYIEYWSGGEASTIWLEDGDSINPCHATEVTAWEVPLFDDPPPIQVPREYRWMIEPPACVELVPLIDLIRKMDGKIFACPGGHDADRTRDRLLQETYG